MGFVEDIFASPAIGFPQVEPKQVFAEHAELLEWYWGQHKPVEDIRSMHLSKQSDGTTHIWVVFHSDPSIVAYRQFREEHGCYIPL